MDYGFNDKEKEICAFLSAIEILKNAVNREILAIDDGITDVSIRAKGSAQERLFLIMNVDFLSKVGKIFPGDSRNTLQLLNDISDMSLLTGNKMPFLKSASQEYLNWLEEESVYSNIYFPSKSIDLSLTIKNIDIVKICGNTSKHNINHLDRVRETVNKILVENNVDNIRINDKDLIFLLQDFDNAFMGDGGFIAKYINCLAYFMNELLWAIYYSLKPVFDKHYNGRVVNNMVRYEYLRPDDLSEEGFSLFWDLMNEVYSRPYIQRFKLLDIWLKPGTYIFEQHTLDKIVVN